MFCHKCGSEIADDSAFCPNCGKPVPAGDFTPPAARGVSSTQALNLGGGRATHARPMPQQGPRASDKTRRIILVASAAVIVVALGVIVATLALGPGGSKDESQASASVSRQAQGSPDATAEQPASGQDRSREEPQQQGQQQKAPAEPVALVDLSDPGDYYDLNIFLSNFSEWPPFYEHSSFNRANPNMEQIVNWAFWHNALNNDALERGTYRIPGAPNTQVSEAGSRLPAPVYARRMQTGLVENSIARYMGLDWSLGGYSTGDGTYYEKDGYLYEGSYRGSAEISDRVVLCDSSQDAGGSTVRVSFTMYSGNHSSDIVADKSWYGMNGAELESAMRATGSQNVTKASGSAVVEVVNTDDGRAFQLVEFSVGQLS